MSTDIFETTADGTGTVRAAFDATAAQCRPDIDALTRRAMDRGQRVRRHRMVGKAVGSAAAAAALGLGTAYALNDSGPSARPATVPGSNTGSSNNTHGGNQEPDFQSSPFQNSPFQNSPTAPSGPTSAPAPATSSGTVAPASTVTASVTNAVATWRSTRRGPLTAFRVAAWL